MASETQTITDTFRPRSESKRAIIEAGGRVSQVLGLPRITGQIFGLLYWTTVPVTLDDLVQQLSISKGSASTGTRQLLNWGAVRLVWVRGDRRDHYEVVPEISRVAQNFVNEFLAPKVASSGTKLTEIEETLDADRQRGTVTPEEHEILAERAKNLCRLQKRLSRAGSLAKRLL